MPIKYFFAFLSERHIVFYLFFFKLDAMFDGFLNKLVCFLGLPKKLTLFTRKDIKVSFEK